MQNRIRKDGYHQKYSRIKFTLRSYKWTKTSSYISRRLASFLPFLIIFFFVSCSTFKKTSEKSIVYNKNAFNSYSKKVCLSSEGKGRIEFLSERHTFSYESLLDNSDEKWTLAIDIPFHGEELIELHFRNIFSDKLKVSGGLYKKFVRATYNEKNGRFYRKILAQYLKNYSTFLKFYSNLMNPANELINNQKCSTGKIDADTLNGSCRIDKKKSLSWSIMDDQLLFFSHIENKYLIEMKFYDDNGEYFERMQIQLKDNKRSNRPLLSLKLFIGECSSLPQKS